MPSNKTQETAKNDSQTITVYNSDVGVSIKKHAQIIDFKKLEDLLVQNVGKTVSKTYIQYTKENLMQYMQSPSRNLNNIRQVSQYLYRISPNYKMLINYYATMPLYSYNVVYRNKDWNKTLVAKKFTADYQNICTRLQNMKINSLSSKVIATCMRDGIYCGFTYDDGKNSFFVDDLDPQYYKIADITDNNTYIVKFDASFFDSGDNKDFLYGVNNDGEGTWDKVFVEGYEAYKNLGNDYRWFELPPERTICVICGEDPITPLPFFTTVFQSLLDLMDYQDLIRNKTELENTVLLLSKIPLLSSTKEVNDFAVDLDLVRLTQQMIDEVAPSLVATAFTPCEVEPVFFHNKDQVDDTNIYINAVKNLFASLGLSPALFGEADTNTGLRLSIKVDESLMYYQMSKLEANIQRYIKLNISESFNFHYHKVTVFSQDEYLDQLRDQATLGINPLEYATVLKTPYELMNCTYMENALDVTSLWKPLSSSYTATDNEGGGVTVKDDDLSEEGERTREKK